MFLALAAPGSIFSALRRPATVEMIFSGENKEGATQEWSTTLKNGSLGTSTEGRVQLGGGKNSAARKHHVFFFYIVETAPLFLLLPGPTHRTRMASAPNILLVGGA